MPVSMQRKMSSAALSLFLTLLCLPGGALATENHKASVSSGTLYMVQEDGSVFGYGRGNIYLRSSRPLDDEVFRVPGLENIVGIEVGQNHALALDADGCIWAWGSNRYGQLGFQEEKIVEKPRMIEGLCGVENFDAGTYSSLFLFEKENSVASWGISVPEEHQGQKYYFDEPIKTVVSYSLSFAVAESGNVYAWGDVGGKTGLLKNEKKSLWEPQQLNVPCRVKELDVSVDVMFVCESGDVYIFGSNTAGTLGTGDTKPVERISKHPTLSGVEHIMGGVIRVAKLKSGEFLGWGDQLLGPAEWTNSGYMVDPTEINTPLGVVDFFSQRDSIFFIDKEGNVFSLIPEEHWLFPVKYSLKDYSFKKYQSRNIEKE